MLDIFVKYASITAIEFPRGASGATLIYTHAIMQKRYSGSAVFVVFASSG